MLVASALFLLIIIIIIISPQPDTQFTLPDHGYGASASRGLPVYVPAFLVGTAPTRGKVAKLS